ncbi:hypothetical protein, partial [Klebsiella pneumoniae]|uniref:hypothetical protein n=1 Tax=Klebsiella pneumoniae TaxID=573 RepID=UPI001A9290E2
EWVHVQLHQQKGMISLSPPTICNSATDSPVQFFKLAIILFQSGNDIRPTETARQYDLLQKTIALLPG